MRKNFFTTATMAALCLTFVLSAFVLPDDIQAQTDGTAKPLDQTQLVKDIDSLLDTSFASDQPGAAVIVLRGGEVVYKSARGMANLELQVPLTEDMVFRIGSMTKQFTSAAIMLLVEEDKISVTDEITRFLPDYPTQGATITVEHLLTHTSGIRSYTSMPGWMDTKIVNPMTVEELVDGFKNEPMDFQPGAEFRYNNSGYVLLGAIIEAASGQTYAEFIQQRIFDPLQMKNSYYGEHAAIIRNRVPGYDGSIDDPQNARYLSMTQPYAAGSLLSTVEDLGKWDTALFAGEVVGKDSLARMITNYKLSDDSLAGYGYGLMPGDIRGHKAIVHGGGIFGFVTHGVHLPDDDVYVAVLCNSSGLNPGSVGTKIAAMAAGDPFPVFEKITVAVEVLKRYVGVYKIDEKSRRYVTVKDGQLYTKRSDGSRLAASPSSETTFFYDVSPSHFEFVIDEQDNVTGMQMYQGGSKTAEVAVRVDEEMPAEREVAVIDFAVYDDYVGEFELAPGFSITISRDGERLLGQATGQPEFELFPASETVFFLTVVDAELSFVRNENGEVNNIVLDQGGAKMPGVRK
ncbi:MAG: serine hydrolase [Candidatus Krumholzibacteria bacterium]|nr:serine hydrolase [Candidatus Krumholzibacteria bacterium]